jgi:hypothetical protein
MAMTFRMLPAVSGGSAVGAVGPSQSPTRSYSCASGSAVDVTMGDETVLVSQDFIPVCLSGSASTRRASTPPNYFRVGQFWLDTDNTAQGILVYDGATWRLPTGAAVA